MMIQFSMNRIKNMDMLYTSAPIGTSNADGRTDDYHGTDYCKLLISDLVELLPVFDDVDYKDQGERFAKETFVIISNGIKYTVSFEINTFGGKTEYVNCSIQSPDSEKYDKVLERLKITLKNRLLQDWAVCTWLVDDQSELLCKEAFQKAYHVENSLRALVSKILIHFLGVNWLKRAGLEKFSLSIKNLQDAFLQRVPELDDINTEFFSMTLETLTEIIFEGKVYEDNVTLSNEQYNEFIKLCGKEKIKVANIADFIKSKRVISKNIWKDFFVPYIENPEEFKSTTTGFIMGRNHIAHSKLLTYSAYQRLLQDFESMELLIARSNDIFDTKEASNEVLTTWIEEETQQTQEEMAAAQEEYYRYRLSSEAGVDILDDEDIYNWFDEIIEDLYNSIYQNYHLDMGFEVSVFSAPSEDASNFSVTCMAVEDGTAKVNVSTECIIDSELGETSVCGVVCKDGNGKELIKAEIKISIGDGYENEDGLMEANKATEYDDSEMEEFLEALMDIIDNLNPYPSQLDMLAYESKGSEIFVADFPCDQCGKMGVSINDSFLPIGRCCYCGYENELLQCGRCGKLVDFYSSENGFCPSCASYIEKQ